jgi:hypothetical protein
VCSRDENVCELLVVKRFLRREQIASHAAEVRGRVNPDAKSLGESASPAASADETPQ